MHRELYNYDITPYIYIYIYIYTHIYIYIYICKLVLHSSYQ